VGIVGNHKARKYGNKKYEFNGVKFDSKLEMFLFNRLNELKIDFDFQVPIILQEKFRFKGVAIREIGMRIDFVVKRNGKEYFTDTKGFATPEAKIKFKMLKFIQQKNENVEIIWLKNQKEVNEFLTKIY